MKTYVCNQCGNVIAKIIDSGVPVMCCGTPMTEQVPNTTEASVEQSCDLQPMDHKTTENYIVCNCKQVSYFTILDEVQKNSNIEQLLDVFEQVKDTTHCSTGCGGCYDKVIEIISESMSGGKK